jgi:hypothetical protein
MYKLKLHKFLTKDKWQQYSTDRQLLMIANETNRLLNAIDANQSNETITETFERTFELLDLTISCQKSSLRKELLRWREMFASLYNMNLDSLKKSLPLIKQLHKVLLSLNSLTWELA